MHTNLKYVLHFTNLQLEILHNVYKHYNLLYTCCAGAPTDTATYLNCYGKAAALAELGQSVQIIHSTIANYSAE